MTGLVARWFGNTEKPATRVPDGMRVYAIGDIHGCDDLLGRLLEAIDADRHTSRAADIRYVFLGDYVDRGTQSREVVERLIGFKAREPATIFLKGNHDATLLEFLGEPDVLQTWRGFGGLETLQSYGVNAFEMMRDGAGAEAVRDRFADALPPAHLRFLRGLATSATIGDYLFVHAGIRPNLPIGEQSEQDLLWIRDEFLRSRADHGKIVVHGHTPSERPEIMSNRIGIDTGAYMTGRLTCLALEGTERRFLTTRARAGEPRQ